MGYLPFILFTVFTNAVAQMMLKQGMLTLGPVGDDGPATALSLVTMFLKVIFHPWVFADLVTFVISMASHLYVLSKVELSFAYPFLSLAYVAVAVAAWLRSGNSCASVLEQAPRFVQNGAFRRVAVRAA